MISRSFTPCIQSCDPTDIRSVGVKLGHILSDIRRFSIATPRILVGWQICQREVQEQLKLHNLRIYHITI